MTARWLTDHGRIIARRPIPCAMRSGVLMLGSASLAVTGFWLGWMSSGHASVAPRPTPSPAPSSAGTPAAEQLRRGLLCASRGPSSAPASDECAAERLRATWCEGQLAECEHSRQAVRHPWPEEAGVEDPTEWTDAVEAALAQCEIAGVELELIDCSEYPCVAALRPEASGGPDSEAFRAEQQRVEEEVRGCGPLRAAFGLQERSPDKGLAVFANDTVCSDGSRADFFALMALHPDGPAYDLVDDEGQRRSKREERDLFRWIFRRGDDVAAAYSCG